MSETDHFEAQERAVYTATVRGAHTNARLQARQVHYDAHARTLVAAVDAERERHAAAARDLQYQIAQGSYRYESLRRECDRLADDARRHHEQVGGLREELERLTSALDTAEARVLALTTYAPAKALTTLGIATSEANTVTTRVTRPGRKRAPAKKKSAARRGR